MFHPALSSRPGWPANIVRKGAKNFAEVTIVTVRRQRKWDKMARGLRDTRGRCWSG